MTGTCIPQSECCTVADCPTPANGNVMSTSCSSTTTMGGSCSLACDSGYSDFNGTYSDGCECKDHTLGRSCGGAANLGAVMIGQSTPYTGTLSVAGEEAWVEVSFPNNTDCAYHPLIQLTPNPNSEFVFDVYSDPGCTTPVSCGTEGGNCTGKLTWEVTNLGDTPCLPPVNAGPNGGVTTYWVRVYRAATSTTLTCNVWKLTISD
jgi:hypothetical protein